MSALAHPNESLPLSFRRRHLAVVGEVAPESTADVIAFPMSRARPALAPRRPVLSSARPSGQVAQVPLPVRLTVRGRRVMAVLAFVVAAAVGGTIGLLSSAPTPGPGDIEVITVTSGDTLWSIASQVAGPEADVREVMSTIAALNNLDGGAIVAGQTLTVPSQG